MKLPARFLFAVIDPMKGLARALLPRSAVGALDGWYKSMQARRILSEPDRLFMRDVIVPALLRIGVRSVLFVGVRRYTRPVLQQMEAGGVTVWTADIDPEAAAFGVPARHAVADITAPPGPMLDRSFDAIIMNGVFGYGVDDVASCRTAFLRLRGMLATDGILVVGWNTDRCPPLLPLAEGLVAAALAGRNGATFPATTHRYDFFRHAQPGA